MSFILVHSQFIVEDSSFLYTIAQETNCSKIQELLLEQMCELDPNDEYLFDFVIEKNEEATVKLIQKSDYKLYSVNHFVLLNSDLSEIE